MSSRAARGHLLVAAVVLAIPSPGTTSRARDFCDAWLALETTGRHAAVARADAIEARGDAETARHRDGVRARVVDALSGECGNWHLLMDFEVRAIVDRVQRDAGSR